VSLGSVALGCRSVSGIVKFYWSAFSKVATWPFLGGGGCWDGVGWNVVLAKEFPSMTLRHE